ncbi:MAG: ferrous iron transport protein A [Clostridia bacterium]|nr:ferrous iron transport protein A [Clostridia bacterium]
MTRYLCDLAPGESGVVAAVTAGGGMGRRLCDLGLIPGTAVSCVGRSPCGDPSAYRIRGAVIAIRACDARCISIRAVAPT